MGSMFSFFSSAINDSDSEDELETEVLVDNNQSSIDYNQRLIDIHQYGHFGWIPQRPDHRDRKLLLSAEPCPEKIKLENLPEVYNQGHLGSCTAQAIAGAFEIDIKKQNQEDFVPSRLFIYYNERALEGSVLSDNGAILRDGMKTINTDGVPHESIWPYNISVFRKRPVRAAYMDAKEHKSVEYYSVENDVQSFKSALNMGYPVIFGFSVPETFVNAETAQSGIMKVPAVNERIVGGHAVLACGYDDLMESDGHNGFLYVRNSWGTPWGQEGYFWMPYDFVDMKMCADCWVLKTIST